MEKSITLDETFTCGLNCTKTMEKNGATTRNRVARRRAACRKILNVTYYEQRARRWFHSDRSRRRFLQWVTTPALPSIYTDAQIS
jgi:hypothetical protein